ncbi:MAG: chromate transporter [Anaerostipes sp.]|uniref:chromate transporter n=1 Tax=Anaerostipes sp. TaxID=1872530 RepID=UPI003992AB68
MEKQRKKRKTSLWFRLFWATFSLSAFTFGGGYVIITLMKKKFVNEYHWIEEDEMLDLVAIAQSAPGAIAVNGAIVAGYKLAKMTGVVICVIAAVLPPFLIISMISLFYDLFRQNQIVAWMLSGMQSGVAAVIVSVVYEMIGSLMQKEKRTESTLILIVAFAANAWLKINVIYIILACIGIGLVKYKIFGGEVEKQ